MPDKPGPRDIAGQIAARGPGVNRKFEAEFEFNLIRVSEVSARLKGKHARLDSGPQFFPKRRYDAEGKPAATSGGGNANPRESESGKTG